MSRRRSRTSTSSPPHATDDDGDVAMSDLSAGRPTSPTVKQVAGKRRTRSASPNPPGSARPSRRTSPRKRVRASKEPLRDAVSALSSSSSGSILRDNAAALEANKNSPGQEEELNNTGQVKSPVKVKKQAHKETAKKGKDKGKKSTAVGVLTASPAPATSASSDLDALVESFEPREDSNEVLRPREVASVQLELSQVGGGAAGDSSQEPTQAPGAQVVHGNGDDHVDDEDDDDDMDVDDAHARAEAEGNAADGEDGDVDATVPKVFDWRTQRDLGDDEDDEDDEDEDEDEDEVDEDEEVDGGGKRGKEEDEEEEEEDEEVMRASERRRRRKRKSLASPTASPKSTSLSASLSVALGGASSSSSSSSASATVLETVREVTSPLAKKIKYSLLAAAASSSSLGALSLPPQVNGGSSSSSSTSATVTTATTTSASSSSNDDEEDNQDNNTLSMRTLAEQVCSLLDKIEAFNEDAEGVDKATTLDDTRFGLRRMPGALLHRFALAVDDWEPNEPWPGHSGAMSRITQAELVEYRDYLEEHLMQQRARFIERCRAKSLLGDLGKLFAKITEFNRLASHRNTVEWMSHSRFGPKRLSGAELRGSVRNFNDLSRDRKSREQYMRLFRREPRDAVEALIAYQATLVEQLRVRREYQEHHAAAPQQEQEAADGEPVAHPRVKAWFEKLANLCREMEEFSLRVSYRRRSLWLTTDTFGELGMLGDRVRAAVIYVLRPERRSQRCIMCYKELMDCSPDEAVDVLESYYTALSRKLEQVKEHELHKDESKIVWEEEEEEAEKAAQQQQQQQQGVQPPAVAAPASGDSPAPVRPQLPGQSASAPPAQKKHSKKKDSKSRSYPRRKHKKLYPSHKSLYPTALEMLKDSPPEVRKSMDRLARTFSKVDAWVEATGKTNRGLWLSNHRFGTKNMTGREVRSGMLHYINTAEVVGDRCKNFSRMANYKPEVVVSVLDEYDEALKRHLAKIKSGVADAPRPEEGKLDPRVRQAFDHLVRLFDEIDEYGSKNNASVRGIWRAGARYAPLNLAARDLRSAALYYSKSDQALPAYKNIYERLVSKAPGMLAETIKEYEQGLRKNLHRRQVRAGIKPKPKPKRKVTAPHSAPVRRTRRVIKEEERVKEEEEEEEMDVPGYQSEESSDSSSDESSSDSDKQEDDDDVSDGEDTKNVYKGPRRVPERNLLVREMQDPKKLSMMNKVAALLEDLDAFVQMVKRRPQFDVTGPLRHHRFGPLSMTGQEIRSAVGWHLDKRVLVPHRVRMYNRLVVAPLADALTTLTDYHTKAKLELQTARKAWRESAHGAPPDVAHVLKRLDRVHRRIERYLASTTAAPRGVWLSSKLFGRRRMRGSVLAQVLVYYRDPENANDLEQRAFHRVTNYAPAEAVGMLEDYRRALVKQLAEYQKQFPPMTDAPAVPPYSQSGIKLHSTVEHEMELVRPLFKQVNEMKARAKRRCCGLLCTSGTFGPDSKPFTGVILRHATRYFLEEEPPNAVRRKSVVALAKAKPEDVVVALRQYRDAMRKAYAVWQAKLGEVPAGDGGAVKEEEEDEDEDEEEE